MTFGLMYAYRCTKCGTLKEKFTLASGNTFRAKTYSDGKLVANGIMEIPQLVKCGKCGQFFWLRKENEVGCYKYKDYDKLKQMVRKEEVANVDEIETAVFLTINEYHEVLGEDIIESVGDEHYLRRQLWWKYNDRIRDGVDIFIESGDEKRWEENLIVLLTLMDERDIDEKIMLAELYRNLGNFKKCMELLDSIDELKGHILYKRVSEECVRKNRWMVQLND